MFQNKQTKLGNLKGRRQSIGHVSLIIGVAGLLAGKNALMQGFEKPGGPIVWKAMGLCRDQR